MYVADKLIATWDYYFNKAKQKIGMPLKTIPIQATEGGHSHVLLESMLTGVRLNTSIPGTINAYTTYNSQVMETYRKYNGFASFGSQQLRSAVDLRTAFIAGEGISISAKDEQTALWIEDFIEKNKLNGPNFINAVKGSEMVGQSLLLLKMAEWQGESLYVKVMRVPYKIKMPYRPVYSDPLFNDEVIDIMIRKDNYWVSAGFQNFVYVRTGGDDGNSEGPVTKVGIVLTDFENYDRAIKDIRRNNHIFARITPHFKVETENEAAGLRKTLAGLKWKIGDAFIGSAGFEYVTPGTSAHENLIAELVATIKTISAVTGVPVHWLGFVDLMSNRATAETLYEFIKNATINERSEWENAIHSTIVKSQELYINNGGTELAKLDRDFQVKLPLIDFGNFLERIRGLGLAFADEAISMDDYRNAIPGINPMKTERAVEAEREKSKEELGSVGPVIDNLGLNEEEEE